MKIAIFDSDISELGMDDKQKIFNQKS